MLDKLQEKLNAELLEMGGNQPTGRPGYNQVHPNQVGTSIEEEKKDDGTQQQSILQ